MSTNLLKSCRILSDVGVLVLSFAGSEGVSNKEPEKKSARSKARRRIATSRISAQSSEPARKGYVTADTSTGDDE